MKNVMNLNQMLVDNDVAYDVITTSCTESENTSSIMLGAGFNPQTDRHLQGMLISIRVTQLKDIREKSWIFVKDGSQSVENCFAKHGSKFIKTNTNFTVIEGYVVIAKNPCLHPGDIQVLKAVNVSGLKHLVDRLIFPQKGERPHTDEALGSDLDVVLYFVT
nr:RNA-dependent RNA polymerase 6 [Tanacetum cinerariifolium]